MDKNTLRIKYMQIRDSLPPKAREECSQKICSIVAETQEFKDCEVLLCYSPIRTEVDVMQLFDMAVSEGKTVGFPRVDGDDMEFYAVSSCEPPPVSNRPLCRGRLFCSYLWYHSFLPMKRRFFGNVGAKY